MRGNLKKTIILLIVISLLLGGSLLIAKYKVNKSQEKQGNIDENKQSSNNNSTSKIEGKTLVVYFSATNNTKKVAEVIAKELDADIFTIEPKDAYSEEDLDYNNSNSRVSKEHDDKSLREVELKTTKVENWDSYKTVLIGYPIWWQEAAWPVSSFVAANDFKDKTVIPFCTSASSDIGESGELLAKSVNSGNWLDGKRFSSSESETNIKKWLDGLK